MRKFENDVKAFCKLPMDLQLFAEGGDGAGADGGNAADPAREKAQAVKVELAEIPLHLLMTS